MNEAVELDHFFICASAGAPQAERLIELGLTEGASNTHPGQGTACRRFFFANGFLELVWVADAAEAQSPATRRTRLWERWSGRARGASPFGVCVRAAVGQGGAAPFATWEYRPAYLPEPLVIHMGANSETVSEPLLFAFGRPANSGGPSRRQPIEHAAGLRSISRLRISGTWSEPTSPELRALEQSCPTVSLASAGEDLMEVEFDNAQQGKSADFRPQLPLVFRW